MKQTSKRFFSMLLSLAFLVAAFIVFFDLIQPVYGDLQVLKGKQLSDKDFLTTARDTVKRAKDLIAQYDNESQVRDSLALAIPSGPGVAGALAQIYGIAQNNSIGIQNLTFSPPTVRLQSQPASGSSTPLAANQIVKPMGTFSITIAAFGSYESFKNFLSQLETNLRIFDVTALSLQPSASVAPGGKGPAAAPDIFNYSLTATTYYQIP